MNVARGNKLVCCILASILIFVGVGVALSTSNSSFLRAENSHNTTHTNAYIYSTGHDIEETVMCTLSMIHDGSSLKG